MLHFWMEPTFVYHKRLKFSSFKIMNWLLINANKACLISCYKRKGSKWEVGRSVIDHELSSHFFHATQLQAWIYITGWSTRNHGPFLNKSQFEICSHCNFSLFMAFQNKRKTTHTQAVVIDNRLGLNSCHAISRSYQVTLMSCGTAKHVSVDCTLSLSIYIYTYGDVCMNVWMYECVYVRDKYREWRL